MAKPTPKEPIYQAGRRGYEIDRCGPQVRAMREGKIELQALSKGHYPGTTVPANVLPGLSSIGFWNAEGAQDWGEDLHRNEGIEIVFLEKGATAFVMERKTHHLHAGHFTIARPWQLHKFGAPNIGPCRLHWLILDVGVRRPHQDWRWPKWIVLTKDNLAELTRKLRHNENPVWNSTPVIAQSFRELAHNLAIWNQPHAVSRLAVYLNQLLIGILDALTRQQTQENEQLTSRRRTVEIFLHDLEDRRTPAGEAWTLDSMAAHCGLGVTTFSKYCRELVNAGPMEFLNHCRLDRAARQLREQTGLSVTEIAFANGFNSSQYFATCFRRRFQVSPSQFLRRSRAAKNT
jgi:AraC family L-rhamnose operon regulatory protein RhaS